jgi:hypothetical protein
MQSAPLSQTPGGTARTDGHDTQLLLHPGLSGCAHVLLLLLLGARGSQRALRLRDGAVEELVPHDGLRVQVAHQLLRTRARLHQPLPEPHLRLRRAHWLQQQHLVTATPTPIPRPPPTRARTLNGRYGLG